MKTIAKGYLVDKRLSASQIQSALNGYSDYYQKYILGVSFSNKYTRFGTSIHEMIQNQELDIEIPKGNNEVKFEKEYKGIVLNGYLDIETDTEIIEIKTSKDITDIDKYRLQCDLYQFVTEKPVRIFVLETQEIGGELSLTGNYKEVVHKYNETQILADIEQAKELIESYNEIYQKAEVNVEVESLTIEYQKLKLEIEELEKRQDEIKEILKEKVPNGYKSDTSTVFYTERKTYTYPEDISTDEAKLKERKKEFEKIAKDYKITKSITIK